MVTYFLDDFTGSNGSAWNASNWTSHVSSTGASATIQSNQGRLSAGTSAGGSNKRSQKYAGANLTDVEISGKVTLPTTNGSSAEVWVRTDAVTPDSGNGYFLTFRIGSAVTLSKGAGFTYPSLGSTSVTVSQNTQYGFRLYAVGSSIKAKVWATSGSEPSSYQVSVTDTTHSGSGLTILTANNGVATGMIADFDDVKLTDGTDNQFTYVGSIAPTAGTFRRNLVTKNAFTGSSTPVGVWSYIKVVTRVFTGATTAVGVVRRSALKILTGSALPVGFHRKDMRRTFNASITSTGVFRKAFVRKFIGTIATVGTATVNFAGRVFGRPGIVRVTVEKAGQVRMRARRG